MKNILIIYPHWPPSNLAGVHRARLIGNFLKEFGWQPIVLTVKPEFYEEILDENLCETVSPDIQVEYVEARSASKKLRLIGDIALRAFGQLKRGALEIINKKKIDFIWIPIPSFYTAILGRLLYDKTKIPYGIDYIDPWVNGFVNFHRPFSRAWISNQLAKFLEPFSVKKASLISGVSKLYYLPVLERNFKNKKVEDVAMPYGFDPNDHRIRIDTIPLPWGSIKNCKPIIYAGAFLPKSHLFLQNLFQHISNKIKEKTWDENVHLFFVGTGNYQGKTIAQYAKEYGIEKYIHEDSKRYPFLHILNFLLRAYGVMIIGSTEKHYTASKTFQSLLSENPVFAVFHSASSAVEVMKEVNADDFLVTWHENINQKYFEKILQEKFDYFLEQKDNWNPTLENLDKYSAKESARKLAEKLDIITK